MKQSFGRDNGMILIFNNNYLPKELSSGPMRGDLDIYMVQYEVRIGSSTKQMPSAFHKKKSSKCSFC